jgi:hypothetical protein
MNLVNFMKIIVPESFRERVIFKPVDITCKCVIIPNQSKELVIVPINFRFEKWIKCVSAVYYWIIFFTVNFITAKSYVYVNNSY